MLMLRSSAEGASYGYLSSLSGALELHVLWVGLAGVRLNLLSVDLRRTPLASANLMEQKLDRTDFRDGSSLMP
jgi:hypothetical protein